MKKQIQESSPNRVTNQTKPMPGVANKSIMPENKQIHGRSVASPPSPNKGQTARSPQGDKGSTNASSDGGGEGSNSSIALHNKIFGK